MSGETTRRSGLFPALLLLAATAVTLVTLGGLRTPVDPAPEAQEPAALTEDPSAEAIEAAPEAASDDSVAAGTPLRVRIGAIAVDAPIVPVGLQDDGAMEIPERVAEIGWYDPDGLGVEPGARGTAVLAGHVDSRSEGRGALYDLRDLRSGETIELDLADGTTQRWLITEVAQYPKDAVPLHEIFTWAGESRLAVITCGGEFDRTARSYADNIIVYAEPLQDPSAA